MGKVIVVQFISIDGVVEDPDGSGGTEHGGWAMRHGPQGVAGDKFRLGPILADGYLLFGRRTWDHFRTLWPNRDDDFSRSMNAASKAVVTHGDLDPAGWSNSVRVDRPLLDWVRERVPSSDLVVIGSGSLVRQLDGADLIDEYRLITFPEIVGGGRRLPADAKRLSLVSAEQTGPATLAVYTTRPARSPS